MMHACPPTWNWPLLGPPYFAETVLMSADGTPAISQSIWFFSIWSSEASPFEFGKLLITIWFGFAKREPW